MYKSRNEQKRARKKYIEIVLEELRKTVPPDLESDPKGLREWVGKAIIEIEEKQVNKFIKELGLHAVKTL